ncbi:MAG: flavodoxin family protein [Pseudomonadota bacterium]
MKIIGVSCSPRSGQSTHFALQACLESAAQASDTVKTELIDLGKLTVNGCLACGKCTKEPVCPQKDDFMDLVPKLLDPDLAGLIIATPVYFGSMTSQAKAFLDRCVLVRRNGAKFRNVVGGVIAVGGFRHGGQETTIHAVHGAMLIQDMIIVGDGNTTFHFGGTVWSGHPDGYKLDTFGLDTVKNLGKRVAGVAALVHSRKE